MARRVYFAFHYADVENFRVNVVRNSWRFKPNREAAGFYDASLWEKVKKEGDLAIKRMINKGLENTSVTVILAGSHTYTRRWVRYEIYRSFIRGNGLITVYIHNIPDKSRKKGVQGRNPLDYFYFRILDSQQKIEIWEFDLSKNKWVFIDTIRISEIKYNFGRLKEGRFSEIFPSYDWIIDNGNINFGYWVEDAAAKAGK
jgi:hypothetical protein